MKILMQGSCLQNEKIFINDVGNFFISVAQISAAALIEKNASVAIMDLGTHEKTTDKNLDLMNIEKAASEYVIRRLVEKTKLNVVDRYAVQEKLKNLDTEGLISPEEAKKFGEILGVKYIIYGNVTNFSTYTEVNDSPSRLPSESTTIYIEAQIVIRIMDVETGKIIMAAKGTGKDTSYSINVAGFISAGEYKVTEQEVRKAVEKAAFKATDILVERLFGKK